ncbi:MAG TPA: MerR family transcriptional regulator [Actinomycetota bacterium]|nr:MerR family transcriptional regulator [Actinomycetota bacterium]
MAEATMEWTIDELARRAGTTTRNIRSYQTRGILPPPRMVGRVGYYGEGHLARLKYTARLQERGFSLAAISALLSAWEEGRSLQDVLGFEEALTAPWTDEVPGRVTRARLEELFPEIVQDPALLRRALALGLLVPEGEEFVTQSPRMLRNGAELIAVGMPLSMVLDEYERLSADLKRIAERFVAMFEHYVWEPFVQDGWPVERLAGITDALQRVRPAATTSVQAVFAQEMEDAVAASTARQFARIMQPDTQASGS